MGLNAAFLRSRSGRLEHFLVWTGESGGPNDDGSTGWGRDLGRRTQSQGTAAALDLFAHQKRRLSLEQLRFGGWQADLAPARGTGGAPGGVAQTEKSRTGTVP